MHSVRFVTVILLADYVYSIYLPCSNITHTNYIQTLATEIHHLICLTSLCKSFNYIRLLVAYKT